MENLEARFSVWFNKSYEFTQSPGKIKAIGMKKYFTHRDIANKFVDLITILGEEVETKDVLEVIESIRQSIEDTEQISPVDYIVTYINQSLKSGKYKANRNLSKIAEITQAGALRDITVEDLLNDILVENDKTNRFKTDVLKRAFSRALANFCDDSLDDLISDIRYDAASANTLDSVLKEIYEHLQIKESYDIFSTLMKHWMWQVKRYVTGKKVYHHIWLNFTGASGLGKTTLIEKLCKPFSDYYSQCQVDILFDATREIKKLTDNFIISFDELACGSRAYVDSLSTNDMAMLKAILTQDELQTRIMGGQQQYKANRRFSCISSSNSHLYDTFYDPSSMRRYFDFTCGLTKVNSYDHINSVLEMVSEAWKGVNEELEHGYFDPNSNVGVKIREIQSRFYPTNTTVHAWCVENEITEVDFTDKQEVKDLYDSYVTWCANNYISKHKSKPNFDEALSHYCTRKKKLATADMFTHKTESAIQIL